MGLNMFMVGVFAGHAYCHVSFAVIFSIVESFYPARVVKAKHLGDWLCMYTTTYLCYCVLVTVSRKMMVEIMFHHPTNISGTLLHLGFEVHVHLIGISTHEARKVKVEPKTWPTSNTRRFTLL